MLFILYTFSVYKMIYKMIVRISESFMKFFELVLSDDLYDKI